MKLNRETNRVGFVFQFNFYIKFVFKKKVNCKIFEHDFFKILINVINQ